MKCPPFDYHRATSVDDAVDTLRTADEPKILAGGQSLVPVLAMRLARPDVLVDVNHVPGLDGLEVRDGVLRAGALVRHLTLAAQTRHPLAAEAARWIGHTAIRSRGTLAGSLAHADPAAELPLVLAACDGAVHVAGPDGTRRIPAAELFAGPLMSTVGETEMITSVELPVPERWGFAEFARRHGDFAVVAVAAVRCRDVLRVAVGGVGGTPHAVVVADPGAPADVARTVAAAVDPTSDLHGSAAYRRALTEQLTRRALETL